MGTPAVRIDPLRGYNFRFEATGIQKASFRECSGLNATTDPVDYREGQDPLYVRKLTGLRKFSPSVVLKRGYTQDPQLANWYANILSGVADRRNCAVVLENELQVDQVRWELGNAWITKYEGATMNATSNDVAIESIEIVAETITISFPS
jgi:phage tail-like protein